MQEVIESLEELRTLENESSDVLTKLSQRLDTTDFANAFNVTSKILYRMYSTRPPCKSHVSWTRLILQINFPKRDILSQKRILTARAVSLAYTKDHIYNTWSHSHTCFSRHFADFDR